MLCRQRRVGIGPRGAGRGSYRERPEVRQRAPQPPMQRAGRRGRPARGLRHHYVRQHASTSPSPERPCMDLRTEGRGASKGRMFTTIFLFFKERKKKEVEMYNVHNVK